MDRLLPITSEQHQVRRKPQQLLSPKNAIGQIIGRKGNNTNKIQSQNNVEITSSLTVSNCQDVKETPTTSRMH